MDKINQNLKNAWAKTKEFMTKEYYGIPVWGYATGLVVIAVGAVLLIPKKKYK